MGHSVLLSGDLCCATFGEPNIKKMFLKSKKVLSSETLLVEILGH